VSDEEKACLNSAKTACGPDCKFGAENISCDIDGIHTAERGFYYGDTCLSYNGVYKDK